MKIGDEVYVHGYVDEIRNDVVIIRNDGGYFGTVPSEMFYYEEDGRGYGTMNEADTPQIDEFKNFDREDLILLIECQKERIGELLADKDTPQTDCDTCRHYKLACELFSEVCKYEPTTQTETQNLNLTLTEGVWNAGYKTGYDKGYKDAQKVKDRQDLVKDLVKAFGEDGTWLERQGVYTLTLAEAKQRAVDIIEAVLRKDEADTQQPERSEK